MAKLQRQQHESDLGLASDSFAADSEQYVSTQPVPVVIQDLWHAYEIPTCLPTYFAVILHIYTPTPAVHQALLKTAEFGTGHWVCTT